MATLEEQIQQTREKLAALQEKDKARKAKIRQRENAQKRKDDTRRKILIGAYYLDLMEKNEEARQKLLAVMGKYLEKEKDRQLFDLPPLTTED